jgi:galactose oxidase
VVVPWELLDRNPASVSIVAAGDNLYQLHNNGNIWRYTGPPITGWELLDNNPATKQIAAAGNKLYQIHNNGFIWKYTGTQATGWELLDRNPATMQIAAAEDALYQIHSGGRIWKASGPAQMGQWEAVFELPNVAIHTHVLPNGNVLFWGRRNQPTGSMNEHECTPLIWDPTAGGLTSTPQPKRTDGTKVNLFCSGHAFLPDGRLLVVGGHLTDGDGLDQACVYDYRSNTWTALPVMNKRRWYPTATALSDGTVLVSSGSYVENGVTIIDDVPQIWDGHQWKPLASFIGLPLYPRMHLAPDGQVFMSGTNAKTYLLDTSGSGAWTPLPEPGGLRRNGERQYAPSVMYDAGKVIYIGGGNDQGSDLPTAATEIIDLDADHPAWQEATPMLFRRRQHNATLLPDGSVLVTGGTEGPGFNDLSPGKPVHLAELWDPATNKWKQLAAEDVDRCYHGTTVLLPDARVLSAGGGEFMVGNQPNNPRDSHRNGQIYHPPYLFQGPRPVITSAPTETEHGKTFHLEVSGPDIGKVTWIRLPSVTHAFDENQRINVLQFSSDARGLTITAPERPEICPPGHYMLFVLSKAGVPSVARIMRIDLPTTGPHATVWPAPTEARPYTEYTGKTRTEEQDEVVQAQSRGTHVTIGLTAKCPYGLGACWGGAYEALKKLDGVAAVRPIPNAQDSTAEVYLRDHSLPKLDSWPKQLANSANASYDFRGVEVTVTGTVRQQHGILLLTRPSFDAPVKLMPLHQGAKLQWDYHTRKVKDLTSEERNAYRKLKATYRDLEDRGGSIHITGPLTKTDTGWTLYVRNFEQ